MAPRQHIRKQPVGKTGFAEAYKSVYEYTSQYPDKAVTFYAQNYPDLGWAILMAGGSGCNVQIQDASLRKELATMRPTDAPVAKLLSNDQASLLYFTEEGETTLKLRPGSHTLYKVSKSGELQKLSSLKVAADGQAAIKASANEIMFIR